MRDMNDVIWFIVKELEHISVIRVQKLLYYCQAWHLVWDEAPLFRQKVYATENSVSVEGIRSYSHLFIIKKQNCVAQVVDFHDDEVETIQAILKRYGKYNMQQLNDLIRMEDPWLRARARARNSGYDHEQISHSDMTEYYGNLAKGDDI